MSVIGNSLTLVDADLAGIVHVGKKARATMCNYVQLLFAVCEAHPVHTSLQDSGRQRAAEYGVSAMSWLKSYTS